MPAIDYPDSYGSYRVKEGTDGKVLATRAISAVLALGSILSLGDVAQRSIKAAIDKHTIQKTFDTEGRRLPRPAV